MRCKEILFFISLLVNVLTIRSDDTSKPWQWICNEKKESCEKISKNNNLENTYGNLATCRLVCGKYGALWPKPTLNCTLSKQLIEIDPKFIDFEIIKADDEAKELLLEYKKIFLRNVNNECKEHCNLIEGPILTVYVSISHSSLTHQWETNEHYTLDISTKGNEISAYIKGENYYGARHGLETLSQLFSSYNSNLMMVNGAHINDKPVYKHRGLLLDTGRNYLTIDSIKRQIIAMASSKMNILHWHATDSQSFPLDLPQVPELSKYGAYSPKKIYTKDNIKEIINFAKLNGIRVIMEIDAPSHAGNGWQWGKTANLGDLAVCVNQQPWRYFCIQPPCGQLNPVNDNVYKILSKLYGDLMGLLPKGEVFHMGGDEVFFPCWNSSSEILSFMIKNGWGTTIEDHLKLWSYFQQRALNEFDSVVGDTSTPIILWSSDLTQPENIEQYLDKNRYVIETWVPTTSNLPEILLEKGYKLIISTKDAWYLDHGFWGGTVYHNWQIVYNNRLLQHPNVLGGEVCMWGELVDDGSIDTKIWPRAAAAGERLWSNPESKSIYATSRFLRHRERLVARGIDADAIGPRWCYQNEGDCN